MNIQKLNKTLAAVCVALAFTTTAAPTYAGNLPTSSKEKPYRSMDCGNLKKELTRVRKNAAEIDGHLKETEYKIRIRHRSMNEHNQNVDAAQKAVNDASTNADKKAKKAALRKTKKKAKTTERELRWFEGIRIDTLKQLRKEQDEENNIRAWMNKKRC